MNNAYSLQTMTKEQVRIKKKELHDYLFDSSKVPKQTEVYTICVICGSESCLHDSKTCSPICANILSERLRKERLQNKGTKKKNKTINLIKANYNN